MYIIVEIQTFENGTVGILYETANTWNQAQSVFHTKLASAAISGLPNHAVTLLNNLGQPLDFQSYTANQEAEA